MKISSRIFLFLSAILIVSGNTGFVAAGSNQGSKGGTAGVQLDFQIRIPTVLYLNVEQGAGPDINIEKNLQTQSNGKYSYVVFDDETSGRAVSGPSTKDIHTYASAHGNAVYHGVSTYEGPTVYTIISP